MLSYVIRIVDHKESEFAADSCIKSSNAVKNKFKIEKFDAITHQMSSTVMKGNGLKWNYPWEGSEIDFSSGLTKTAYRTAVPGKRIACAMSHWLLWYKCVTLDKPILILEHDSIFISKLNYKTILNSKYDIIGINSPASATRKSHEFHDKIQEHDSDIMPVPTIDELTVPQGLAGNSAYIIKPKGAKNCIEATKQYGLWPNDALMCKQLIPNMGVTKTYYTRVQGIPSTTVN